MDGHPYIPETKGSVTALVRILKPEASWGCLLLGDHLKRRFSSWLPCKTKNNRYQVKQDTPLWSPSEGGVQRGSLATKGAGTTARRPRKLRATISSALKPALGTWPDSFEAYPLYLHAQRRKWVWLLGLRGLESLVLLTNVPFWYMFLSHSQMARLQLVCVCVCVCLFKSTLLALWFGATRKTVLEAAPILGPWVDTYPFRVFLENWEHPSLF